MAKKSDAKSVTKKKVAEKKGKILKFLKTKKGIITIFSSLIVLALFAYVIIWNILYVKVTFDTSGGDEMNPIYIRKNSVLDSKYKAVKLGHVFDSWTYSEGQALLIEGEKIRDDIKLVASYHVVPEAGYLDSRVEDVEKDAKIVVHSLVELNNNNIGKYLTVKDATDNPLELKVKSIQDDKYEITGNGDWPAGFSYTAEILSLANLEFVSIGKEIVSSNSKTLMFSVKRENVLNVDYTENTKTAAKSDLVSLTEKGTVKVEEGQLKTYTAEVNNSGDYTIGDVILFGGDTEDLTDDAYYVVTGNTNNGLELRDATFDDVYDDLEFYNKMEIDFSKGGINYDAVASTIQDELYKDQEGLVVLTNMYIEGAYNTKDVLETLENPTEEELEKLVSASKLASIPKEKIHVLITPQIDDDGRMVLRLSISVQGIKLELGSKAAITVTFTLEEQIAIDLIVCHDLVDWEWFNYTGLDLINTFTMSFTIKLETKDGYSVDLGSDVEKFLTDAVNSGNEKYDWVDEINNNHIMENTFDYIPILEKEIFSKMFWVGLVSIDLKLEGVVSIGAEAALSAQYKIVSYYQAGSANGYFTNGGKDVHVYEDGKTNSWNRNGTMYSSFDFSIKGTVGVRAGVKASVSVSALGMNDLYSIGLSLEGGVYCEMTGFVNVSIETKQGRSPKSTINGGLLMEVGLYVEAEFTWNCWPFGMDSTDDINLLEKEFPLYEFSTIGEVLGFDNVPKNNSKENPIRVYTNEYDLYNNENKLAYLTVIEYNKETKKYEAVEKKLNSLGVNYVCHEVWDHKTNSSYCNPEQSINKHVKYVRNLNEAKLVISEEAPDEYQFFFRISGSVYDPITGERIEAGYKDVWFQYEKPVGDGSYQIIFEVPEESGFPSYDKSQKSLTFTVGHGQELVFQEIPESYTKDGKTYVFEKWDTGFDKREVFYNGDQTIKAVFKAQTAEYTYKFHASFGKFKNGTDTLELKAKHGEKFGNVDTPTRTNYKFIGWTTDPLGDAINVEVKNGNLYDLNNNKLEGNIEVFVIWQELENVSEYTLTFNAQDGYMVNENGTLSHTATFKVKKGEEFYNVPIAIKEINDDPANYYVDETFGLTPGFIPTKSQTYTANYKKMARSFEVFISDSTFIKQNGVITYSDDIVAETTDDKWLSATFDKDLSLPTAKLTIDGKEYTTDKYILLVENTKQIPYSINSGASTLKSKYNWIYDTINVSYYGNTTTSILYKPASNINYGTLISYYYGTSGLDLKGISYVSATAVPYFEIS